jgi:hypothetical protein
MYAEVWVYVCRGYVLIERVWAEVLRLCESVSWVRVSIESFRGQGCVYI